VSFMYNYLLHVCVTHVAIFREAMQRIKIKRWYNYWSNRTNPRYTRQAMYCTHNVTLRHFPTTIVAVENQWILRKLSVCVCSLRHPACNAHAPYCHLWSTALYNIFPRFLINGTIFEKKVTEYKMSVLMLLTIFIWNISHSTKKWARYD
jgi:hypothetical protein